MTMIKTLSWKNILVVILILLVVFVAIHNRFTLCNIAISVSPQIVFCAPAPQTFTGIWQGIDPFDGSVITFSLVQTGNDLLGTMSDTYSAHSLPPGYHGKGSGTISSPTTAHIIFDNLTRGDGKTAKWDLQLSISNQNDTLLVSNCYFNDKSDTLGCPMVMKRQ